MKNMKSLNRLTAVLLLSLSLASCAKNGNSASNEANDPNDFIATAAQRMRNVDNCIKDTDCNRAIVPIQSRRITQ